MKRIYALALAALMIVTALISCGGSDVTTVVTTTAGATTTPPTGGATTTTTVTTRKTIVIKTPKPYDPNDPENVVELGSKEDIIEFLSDPSKNYAKKTVKLTADIVLNDTTDPEWYQKDDVYFWTPLNSFHGTFDGQGHTITGVCLEFGSGVTVSADTGYGMFKSTNGATFKNLGLVDAYMHLNLSEDAPKGKIFAGFFSGLGSGGITIENCFVDAYMDVANVKNCGMLAGWTNGTANIKNCYTSGYLTCSTGGALISGANGTIKNCYSTVKMEQYVSEKDAQANLDEGKNWDDQNNLFGWLPSGVSINGCYGLLGQYSNIDPETELPYLNANALNSGYYEKAGFLGEMAKISLSTFDFDNVWQTNEGQAPSLRIFGTKCLADLPA